jgi:small subunit ribosomal protein S16
MGPQTLCRVSQTGESSYNLVQEEVFVLAIRLARIGKKKHPYYRVVVLDKRKPRNGRTVEVVGTYDPLKKPAEIKLDADRIKYWLGCGAQPSDTVRSFLDAQKIA